MGFEYDHAPADDRPAEPAAAQGDHPRRRRRAAPRPVGSNGQSTEAADVIRSVQTSLAKAGYTAGARHRQADARDHARDPRLRGRPGAARDGPRLGPARVAARAGVGRRKDRRRPLIGPHPAALCALHGACPVLQCERHASQNRILGEGLPSPLRRRGRLRRRRAPRRRRRRRDLHQGQPARRHLPGVRPGARRASPGPRATGAGLPVSRARACPRPWPMPFSRARRGFDSDLWLIEVEDRDGSPLPRRPARCRSTV